VKLGAVRASQLASQPDNDRLARGASGESRQRDGAAQASTADAVALRRITFVCGKSGIGHGRLLLDFLALPVIY
jgi:hypothetical protein